MVRNSHQDALSESEFERLVDATDELEPPFDAECLFIVTAAGRLGMRAGEISHMRADWIDWDKKQIKIPAWDPCDHGQNGDICGYCKAQAELACEYDETLSMEKALQSRWEPKTSNSVRAIPFDFNHFAEGVVGEFFADRDRFPHSRVSINRRVDRALEAAGMPVDTCYPHSLRATAASWHAYRGLPAAALQSLFGWSNLSVAQKYLRLSGGATAKALKDAHGD